jgi:flagellar protein FlaG
MTNDISSIIKAQQVPVRGFQAGQTVEIDTVKTNNTSSQEAPGQGNKMPQRLDKAHFESAVSSLNNAMQTVQRDLVFNLDEDSGRVVIKVMDSNSGELIRQIPTEEVLAIAASLQNYSENSAGAGHLPQGMLFSDSI